MKSKAIKNRIYLEPMDKTNIVAEMLVELARGYYVKYGLDEFTLRCVDTVMEYLKNDVNARLMKASYQERLTLTLTHLLNAPNPDIMKEKEPRAYEHYLKMQALYNQIDT